jgi:DNA-binding response OmpR family regulator
MNRKNKILIVDDDTLNLNVCVSILKEYYLVESAINGAEAVSRAEVFMPDIILIDWEMPVMNGIEAIKQIKNNPASNHIQIIMMTGIRNDQKNLLEAFKYGIIDFIKKPFDSLELKARVNSVMQSVNFYQSQIDLKNQELVKLTLLLSENSKLIESVINQIIEIEKTIPQSEPQTLSKIVEVKRNLNSKITKSTWKQFEKHFNEIHPNFYKNITSLHPSITPSELKLAALLSLNMASKEISAILHLSTDSIKVARARLRKKIKLEKDQNLTAYLLSSCF